MNARPDISRPLKTRDLMRWPTPRLRPIMTGRSAIRPAGQGVRKPLHHYKLPGACSGFCSGRFSSRINGLDLPTTPLHEKARLSRVRARPRCLRMRARENPYFLCSDVVTKVKSLIRKGKGHYKGHYIATTNRAKPLQNRASGAVLGAQIARNLMKSLKKVGI